MTIRSVSIPVSRPFAITPWLPFRLDEGERGGCRPSTGSSRRGRAVAVMFSLDQHGPDDARGFGGERHHGDLVGPPREQSAQPWIGDAARLLLPQMSAGSADHVWTAPSRQGLFWCFGKLIGERSCIRRREAAIDRGP